MIEVSIVIITWNAKKFLKRLLESIKKYSSGFTYEIIIVDNNSTDGTIEYLNENHSDIKLIRNKKNLGVAKARNIGMKETIGKYVLILDVDMELIENSIKKMLDFMNSNLDIGLVGSKLVYSNGELQYSCKNFPNILSLLARRLDSIELIKNSKVLKNHLMSDWDHNEIREVDYLIGACQFIRREVIEEIGFYDDTIFYGPEDIDYCIRVWRANWKVVYFPLTTIIHFEQRITKTTFFSKITMKHFLGILYLFRKYRWKLSRYV
ncbi:glycosyltransferase family 2 protein [Rosettibacter firmus]|uniref:glycosyltransferase family 2 protein n=1 Tax=Rosettibacter firmus TaxID=3111522 RepID=UPI00336BFC8A